MDNTMKCTAGVVSSSKTYFSDTRSKQLDTILGGVKKDYAADSMYLTGLLTPFREKGFTIDKDGNYHIDSFNSNNLTATVSVLKPEVIIARPFSNDWFELRKFGESLSAALSWSSHGRA